MEARGRKRNKKGPVLLLLLLIFALALLVISGTSYFVVSDIEIEGNNYITAKEIIEKSGIHIGANIFMVRLGEARKELENHSYILRAEVKRKLPAKIIITVEERELLGYVPFMGSYLLIDSEGTVISATSDIPVRQVPVFNGVEVDGFEVNQILNIENKDIFDKIKYISKNVVNYMAGYAPIEVDISDMENVRLSLNDRFQIKVGSLDRLDYKLKFSDTILEKLYTRDVGGEIDVSEVEKAFFRPW
jgi:cell division septal protein FtsQ